MATPRKLETNAPDLSGDAAVVVPSRPIGPARGRDATRPPVRRGEIRHFPDPRAGRCSDEDRGGATSFVAVGQYEPGKFKGLDELRRKYGFDRPTRPPARDE